MSILTSPCCGQPAQYCRCDGRQGAGYRLPRVTVGPTAQPTDGFPPVDLDIHVVVGPSQAGLHASRSAAYVYHGAEQRWVLLSASGLTFKGKVVDQAALPAGAMAGDVFVVDSTDRAYISNGQNHWSEVNLGGATGPTGQTGDVGPTGPTGEVGHRGPAGPMGTRGIDGPTGPMGSRGLTGVSGPAGATGAQGPVGPGGVDLAAFKNAVATANDWAAFQASVATW